MCYGIIFCDCGNVHTFSNAVLLTIKYKISVENSLDGGVISESSYSKPKLFLFEYIDSE